MIKREKKIAYCHFTLWLLKIEKTKQSKEKLISVD